ncbi:P-loop containing nucleoside triphosphate hydrolase protein [Lentinus tigrinus ALCF2SS1-7]|uniref:P-loop containing nucleoside triphosphate hydrolase protein n=1 Tax=Lentinus tigrinus ALCF2SS1-6 TaxID=1328759 RepID=A0A5C2ST73_9APHY|nr:P-loop containing nucleoside triphosphate hydrolase protein [Lentinus tigrinus ALCF2SS1-6]RPD80269.1 P-loop containing nucleoside triphosphate hydrolase protein [Lentinus tigrinus ALCF2SS1-7]
MTTTPTPILELKNLAWYKEKGQPVFTDVNLVVNEGDILVLQGKSGAGKSTLLKCIAHLNIYKGEVLYRGQKPQHYGIPTFRTRVMYVPQRPSMLPGTPRDFLTTIYTFGVHKSRSASSKAASAVSGALGSSEPNVSGHEAFAVAESWGIEPELWDRGWANLSGGEAQRIVLAIAVGIGSAEVLLLDEPTSALDSESSSKIEKHLSAEVKSPDSTLKSIVWITHSPEQGQRVGTRFIRVTSGGVREENVDPGV